MIKTVVQYFGNNPYTEFSNGFQTDEIPPIPKCGTGISRSNCDFMDGGRKSQPSLNRA